MIDEAASDAENFAFPTWAYIALAAITATVGIASSAVTGKFFVLGLARLESDPVAREVLVAAGLLMIITELIAFGLSARDVPLHTEVVDLLAAHGREFMAEDMQSTDKDNLPLIRTLAASVPQWQRVGGGGVQTVARTSKTGAPLSASGIYDVLKRFFRRAAKTANDAGLNALRFEKASTHWMRHTFVRQALVDGMPIEVASELAGHASIDTTSIYSTQELARKIKAIHGMRRRV